MAEMRIDILTLFPETVHAVLHESILGRAIAKGILEINTVQIRDYTENRQNQVDDYPYGGGYGCVMMAQPLKSCLDAVVAGSGEGRRRVVYLSPQGKTFTQETAKRLQRDYDQLVLICGHYEGVDERFIEACVDEEISLGDFVLTGGEIAAMAVTDAVCRLVPGVLAAPECYIGESHWDGLLEYPQYTRPDVWEGRAVPSVLLQGDHDRVARWRREQQLRRTGEKRPELMERFKPETEEDRKLVRELERTRELEAKGLRRRITEEPVCRKGTEADMPDILRIRDDARESLGRFGVDQWQGEYPEEVDFRGDVERGECFVITHGDEVAAFFTLSTLPEPAYDALRDGKWTEGVDFCVLHRAAVAKEWRGSGMADRLLGFVEEEARNAGKRCVRTDTHRKNKPMQNLLRSSGYRYRGNITIDCEPGHDTERQAFEKILKSSRK